MPEKDTTKKDSKWTELKEAENLLQEVKKTEGSLFNIPGTIKLKHTSGFFFGLVMGVGFCIGFLVSLFILLGIVSFYVYSKFPQLFS